MIGETVSPVHQREDKRLVANEPEDWTLDIKSNPGLFEINLKEIWRYRDLIGLIVRRDFVSAYKQTILGPVWHLAEPLVTTLTYAFIFGMVANISTNGLPRILFYLPGITLWTFFANNLLGAAGTFSANAHIFGKVYFPRLVMPIAATFSSLIAFGLQFLLFVLLLTFHYVTGTTLHTSAWAVLTPLLALMTVLLGLGLGSILSSLTTKYRDVQKLVSVSMRLLMFATPVIYPLSKVPEQYRWIIELNPMTGIVEAFRYFWLGSGSFSWGLLGYSALVTVVSVLCGIVVFNRAEKVAMDSV